MSDDFEDIDDDEENEEGEEGAKKKGIPKLILFGGLGGVILILGAVAAFLLLSGGGDDHAVAEGEHGADGEHAEAEDYVEAIYVGLIEGEGESSTFMVNIRGDDGRPMVLQLELSFQISDPEVAAVLEHELDLIMDQFIAFLSELRQEDLYGSAGAHRVRLELLRRVNLAIEPAHVDQVLIQNFLISG